MISLLWLYHFYIKYDVQYKAGLSGCHAMYIHCDMDQTQEEAAHYSGVQQFLKGVIYGTQATYLACSS
jgi:hypothetical protein